MEKIFLMISLQRIFTRTLLRDVFTMCWLCDFCHRVVKIDPTAKNAKQSWIHLHTHRASIAVNLSSWATFAHDVATTFADLIARHQVVCFIIPTALKAPCNPFMTEQRKNKPSVTRWKSPFGMKHCCVEQNALVSPMPRPSLSGNSRCSLKETWKCFPDW